MLTLLAPVLLAPASTGLAPSSPPLKWPSMAAQTRQLSPKPNDVVCASPPPPLVPRCPHPRLRPSPLFRFPLWTSLWLPLPPPAPLRPLRPLLRSARLWSPLWLLHLLPKLHRRQNVMGRRFSTNLAMTTTCKAARNRALDEWAREIAKETERAYRPRLKSWQVGGPLRVEGVQGLTLRSGLV